MEWYVGCIVRYFNRHRSGLFARRSGILPTIVGATAPRENQDSDRQFGMELELSHRNKIGEVSYNLKGIATITRNEHLTASEKGPWANSYDRWRNNNLTHRYQGVHFGYTSVCDVIPAGMIFGIIRYIKNVMSCREITNMKTGMETVK